MLFEAPELDERDEAVIAAIDEHRLRLRHYLSEPRRWQGQLRRNLRARAIRGSNSIEGYDVSLDDALALLTEEEPLDADQRTTLEVTGYRNAMTYVQQLAADPHFHFDATLLRSLHFMMLGHDLSRGPGAYRTGEVFVQDEDLGPTVYEGPQPEVVPALMTSLVERLERQDDNADQPVLVSAAMAHLNLVVIHPFRDGNGRMARCLQTMILARNQILSPEFSSIEEWLGRNTQAYYDVLAEVGMGSWHPERDAHPWVRFNLLAHHVQAQTVWRRVQDASALWQRLEAVAREQRLPERSVAALYNAAHGLRIRRTVYQIDADVEANTAQRDLKAMVDCALLQPFGATRGRFYVGTQRLRDHYGAIRAADPSRPVDPYLAELSEIGPTPRRRAPAP